MNRPNQWEEKYDLNGSLMVNEYLNDLEKYCDVLEEQVKTLETHCELFETALNNACNYIFDTGYGCPVSENFELEKRMDGACERCIVDTDSISYKYKGVKCWKKLFMKEV